MDNELNMENVEAPVIQSGDQPTGLIQTVLKKITDNKMYLYITIAVIVLGIMLYYFYFKSKKEIQTLTNTTNDKPQLALPKQSNDNQVITEFNPNSNDYFILDTNGNPTKVSGTYQNQPLLPLPIPNQQPSNQEIQMLQKQMLEKQMIEQQMNQQQMNQQQMMQQQMMQQQMMQQQMNQQQMMQKQNNINDHRPKLQHPNSDNENDSDDINIELARIQANEDDNIAQHNLTNSELAEINKKLEMMTSQNN